MTDTHLNLEDKTKTHPCFNKDASNYARLHLPVAKKCNISCNYCNRKYDCNNESRPGVTSDVLTPKEGLERYKALKTKMPHLTVVGIAGPGDALANFKATYETIALIKAYDPNVTFCLSTNGLKLLKYADALIDLGVTHITVTINTLYPEVAAKIYRHIRLEGEKQFGLKAAATLLENQWASVAYLKDKGVLTKVNIVYLKGINDDHIEAIVQKAKDFGADVTNIMPHIPVADTPFESLEKAELKEVMQMRYTCERIMPQMMHCNQCRADAAGRIGGCKNAG